MRDLRRSTAAVVLFPLLSASAVACGNMNDGPVGEDQAAISTTTGSGGASSGGTGGTTGSTTSTSTGNGGGGTGGGTTGPDGGFFGPAQPIGFWRFDDCNAKSAVLLDASGNGNTANRTGTTTCGSSIDGLGVGFAKAKDAVTVADSPAFNFTSHVAVAAWINPSTVSGTQAIVDQQFQGKTTFSLAIVKGMVQFSVTLQTGKTVTSSAPISANTWSHVAGSYDGQFVFLYLDGQQVGQVDLPGAVREANGPITIGNNASSQHFNGMIDDVWLSVDPVQLSDITALSCIQKPATAVATPAAGPPTPFDSSVNYSVAITNNNAGFCAPASYFFQVESPPGFTTQQQSFFAGGIAPGATATFPFTVSVGELPDPGVYNIPFFAQDFSNFSSPPIQGQVTFDLVAPSGCFVFTGRELMVLDTSVVDDPVRTTWNGKPSDPRTGAWTFGALMQNMAPTPAQASAMVQQLFSNWLTDQQVGGFTVPARTAMQQIVLDPWPKLADGSLDLTKAPLRLSAIVNRMDVRNLDQGKAGEGRFVFSVLDPFGNPLQFTLIVEYNLPATTDADVLAWANRWHALSSNPFPSEQYNAALQAITDQFAARGVGPGPNGSALAQLRTNEIALSFEWELREFHLDPSSGFLAQAGTALTPDLSLNFSPIVADYVNQNESTILQQLHVVPQTFEGQPFLAGSSINPITFWSAPGIANNDARQLFSLNTCNGCHGQETGTGFLHIAPRFPGQESQLSGFLTGITVPDPVSGVPRSFGDLAARKADLTSLVCSSSSPKSATQMAVRSALIRHGRRTTH
jgi:hypothetical protein